MMVRNALKVTLIFIICLAASAQEEIDRAIHEVQTGMSGLHHRVNGLESRVFELENSVLSHAEIRDKHARLAEQVTGLKNSMLGTKTSEGVSVQVNVKHDALAGKNKVPTKEEIEPVTVAYIWNDGASYTVNLLALIVALVALVSTVAYRLGLRFLNENISIARERIIREAEVTATGKQVQSITNQAFHSYSTYEHCSKHTLNGLGDGSNAQIETDSWQNYAFLSIAVSLSKMAVDSIEVINADDERSTMHAVYAYCNLCFYLAQQLNEPCFLTSQSNSTEHILAARKDLLLRIKNARDKLTEAKVKNKSVREDWHHLKESLLHSEFYLDIDYANKNKSLKERIQVELVEVLNYAIAKGQRDWYNATLEKWLGLNFSNLIKTQ